MLAPASQRHIAAGDVTRQWTHTTASTVPRIAFQSLQRNAESSSVSVALPNALSVTRRRKRAGKSSAVDKSQGGILKYSLQAHDLLSFQLQGLLLWVPQKAGKDLFHT